MSVGKYTLYLRNRLNDTHKNQTQRIALLKDYTLTPPSWKCMLVAPEMAGTAGEMRYNPTQYNGACQTTHKFR